MEFKTPPIAKLTADNGRDWLSAIRPYLLGAGYWDLIAKPEEEVPQRDKWLGLNDGYSSSKFASRSLSGYPSLTARPAANSQAGGQK